MAIFGFFAFCIPFYGKAGNLRFVAGQITRENTFCVADLLETH